jgi:SAM-dependent methyltransferase
VTSALAGLLACPRCDAALEASGEAVRCASCGLSAPVRDGIPRFVLDVADPLARRTQASFGYEWTHFGDWRPSGELNFRDYFAGIDLSRLASARVLDGGCGMGRHARQMAPHAAHVVAVDFSAAIDQAARNVAECRNVDCIQADLFHLPLAPASFDLVYSMGVVHHVADTDGAVARLARCLKPGGRMRVYLYWRHTGWRGALLGLVTMARTVTTRLPHPVLRALCLVLSLALWGAVILPYRALSAFGADVSRLPLFVYTRYPFRVLYNDQFDRFSAPIEKRYTEDEAVAVLRRAGLVDVRATRRFGWLVDGVKPAGDSA